VTDAARRPDPAGSNNPGLFLLKVVGGSALLVGIGLTFYRHGQRLGQTSPSSAPDISRAD
jgi:hypothetical protein